MFQESKEGICLAPKATTAATIDIIQVYLLGRESPVKVYKLATA